MTDVNELPLCLQGIAGLRDDFLDRFTDETGESYSEWEEALENGEAPIDGPYEYLWMARTIEDCINDVLFILE